jgi:hypothetical protein
MVSLMPKPVSVLLVSKGNRFLEKALKGPPHVQFTVVPVLTDPAEKFDVVVLDDVLPGVWPKPNVLAIHTVNTNWFASWDLVKMPPIVDWKNTHSLLRFVNFDNVQIAEALKVKPPDWGVSLVDSPDTPLIIAGQRDRQRVIWVGFDVLQSTWPLRLSFPIFIANAVEWLNPASTGAAELMVRAGDPFRHGLSQKITDAQLTGPDGKTKPLLLEPNASEILVGDTFRQGIYRLKAGTNDVTFCVNLMDSAESNITPREELPFGKYGKVAASTLKRANMELWRWIAAAGLLVLLFEWWFYHKRTV